eukprot:1160364-Pelagomonas_calceolata.AAC.2
MNPFADSQEQLHQLKAEALASNKLAVIPVELEALKEKGYTGQKHCVYPPSREKRKKSMGTTRITREGEGLQGITRGKRPQSRRLTASLGKGYIAVPACGGSFVEAKRAYTDLANPRTPAWFMESLKRDALLGGAELNRCWVISSTPCLTSKLMMGVERSLLNHAPGASKLTSALDRMSMKPQSKLYGYVSVKTMPFKELHRQVRLHCYIRLQGQLSGNTEACNQKKKRKEKTT